MLAQDQAFLSLARPPAKDRAPSWPPVLDSAGAVSAATWRRWVHHPAADRKPAYAAPIAFVLADGPGGPVQRERLAAIAPGAVVLQAPPDEPDLATLYLFLEPEDIPLPELAAEVRAALNGQVEVVTFDLFRRQDDFVAPCMVPGANLARFQEDDRLYRRGAATAAFLRATSGQSPNAGLRERITYWSQTRSPSNIRAGWRHLGAPLVEAAGPQVNPAFRPRSPNTRTLHFSAGASAIICTRDKGHLTRQLVRQLLRLDDAQLSDVVILSNQTTNPYALQTLADLSSDSRVQILRRDEPFNFSRLCNIGVEHSRGNGPLLFLNDDVAPISEDWLQTLLARLQVPGTGAVGPLLLYPDETVQHAGMYLRLPKGAGHVLRGARLPEDDPLGLAAAPREVSCLTGAVLLTDRAAFQQIGGFDEALALSFQDVDYGLKLHQAGLRNIFEPRAVLLHMESVSLKTASVDPAAALQKHQEWRLFVDRWSSSFPQDPFYPAALDLDDERSRRLAPGGPWGKGPWSKR
jgi:GT2 family glycosyltransferase